MQRSMEVNMTYLLSLAEHHLERAKEINNENSFVDYRMSGFSIVNYYNVLILRSGNNLNLDIKESYNFKRKIFIISQECPELLENYANLFDKIDYVRNKLGHTDISIPNKSVLSNVIKMAKEFTIFIKTLIGNKKNLLKKKTSLIDDYKRKIDFIRLWFRYPEKKYENNIKKQSKNIEKIINELLYYEKINVENLDNTSIQNLISLLDKTLKEAEMIYETIYNYCPNCGGNLILTQEQTTHYVGPYDDPEPHSFSVWRIIQCEKCGEIIEREHITTESI